MKKLRGPRRSGNSFENAKRDQFLKWIERIYGVSPGEDRGTGPPGARELPAHQPPERQSSERILAELREAGAEIEPILWCKDAYDLLSAKRDISESDLFKVGHVHLQNASSLITPLALDPHPGDSEIPSSTSARRRAARQPISPPSYIASLTGNQGELWVNDAIKPQTEKMREILDTFHVQYGHLTGYPGQ